MVGGVLLLVNLGLKLYSELKQTVIKNRIDSCLVKRFCWHLAFIHGLFLTLKFGGEDDETRERFFYLSIDRTTAHRSIAPSRNIQTPTVVQ